MKTIQLMLITLLVNSFCGAQTVHLSKKTIISGKIFVSPNDTITITYYPYKLGDTQVGGITTKHANNDGSFRVEIPDMDHPYYFSIESVKRGGLLLNNQFIEPGDSLMITSNTHAFQNEKKTNQSFFTITGRNADKNQLVDIFDFARFNHKISGLIINIINRYTSLREALPITQKNSDRYKQYWDSLITANDFSISNKTREYLSLDMEIQNIKSLLSVYSNLYEKFTGKQASATALHQLQTDYKEIVEPMLKKLTSKYDFPTVSPYFLDMAVSKTVIDTRIQHSGEKVISGIKYLDAIQQWPVNCREEITTAFIASLYVHGYNIENTPEMFPVLTTLINKPALQSLIQDFEQLYVPGKTVQPFQLTGINGESINISDYKDKVVVLDFWFTGCNGCIQMAKILKIVKERLADDEEIVFMSVSIDKDKETWLKSVAEEKYTHAEFINVYTGGKAMDHPLIKRYTVSAYPRVIIIGKNNKLFTAKPHMPRSFDDIELFLQNVLDAKK